MNFQSQITARLLPLIALVVGILLVGTEGNAQIGFQAEFDEIPNVVSKYDSTTFRFSVAQYPKTYASLTRRRFYQPQISRTAGERGYLIFETKYKGIDSLVPLAVDAKQFAEFRRVKKEREYLRISFGKSLRAARQGKDKPGLNYGIELPERFNRVFGEGGANLRVNGYRRISFSGRSQWTDGQSEAYRQSKFPSLNMEQNYRLDITGTIGSKISVKVSEDSRSAIPLANRIQIRYKGDDDDILKVVEAGNTNLSLPRSRFVGYSSRIQGLFGLKAVAQVGHLTVTAIASQEKGSAEKASISAGGDEGAEYIRDFDYQQGRIFDLGPHRAFTPGDSVGYLEVWQYERDERNEEARVCRLWVDPDDTTYAADNTELIKMVQIDVNTFSVINDADKPTPYVIFNTPRFTSLALGMYMEVYRANRFIVIQDKDGNDTTVNVIDTVGDKSNDTLILKTLRHASIYDHPSTDAWWYMWRNVYKIPSGVNMEDLNLVIKEGKVNNEDSKNLLDYQEVNGINQGEFFKILGLDQYNEAGVAKPDNQIDYHWDVFRKDLGLLIFPSRTPFDTDTTYRGIGGQWPALKVRMPSIYNYTSLNQKTQGSNYFIQYSMSSRSSNIRLNRANIIEGSERVTLNGVELTKDVDYTINYDFGQLTILKEDALDANSELNIDFEYAPFLAIQKKSLLGIRTEYEWSRNLKFGSTFLFKSDRAQDRKPRVGQETANMMVMDFDFSFKIKPSFLTKAVDAVPFISTEAVSNLSVEGEIAQSRPNPNIDNVAYIDDFEASHEQLSLGTTRGYWSLAAHPGHIDEDIQLGKVLWHNTLYGVTAAEVYDREFKKGEGTIAPFRVVFRPNPYDRDPVTGEIIDENARRPSWAGITRSFGNRVDQERVQVLELRVRGTHGRMHLDFGRINEDVDGNTIENDEERGFNEFVSDEEDTGLDLVPDSLEDGYDPLTNPDPAGDNWFFLGDGRCPVPPSQCADIIDKQEKALNGDFRYDSLYYEWLNGTEGNRNDLSTGGRADRERLTREAFNQSDAYFSYVIDLASDSFLVPGSQNQYGWKTYRVPIRDSLIRDTAYSSGDALPDWSLISHIRFWFDNDGSSAKPDTVEIAAWYFVQSNWRDSLVVYPVGNSNSAFVVATVSEEEGTFRAPPGVAAYEDIANEITETQRGLSMIYKDLRAKDTCLARKELISIERYSGYSNLEVYIHGDERNLNDSVQFFFRVGEDEENFYEYRVPNVLYPGWDERNYVNLNFDSMTVLKDYAQRNLEPGKVFNDVDITSGNYRVKGDPSINEVTYFAAGLVNLDTSRTITGEVWLDELRVTNVRRDIGTAARISASGNLADLITYTFNYNVQDAYFRGLSTATRGGGNNNLGAGDTRESYGYGLSFNLDRFLPRSMGLRLPISYNFSRTEQKPLLRVRSDVVLPDEQREKEKTVSETQSIRISESFRHKGKNIIYDVLLNRQKFAFSYSRGNSQSPNRPKSISENYNISGNFDAGWRNEPEIPIFFFLKPIPILKKASESKLSLFPSSWTFAGKFNRSLSVIDDINFNRTTSLRRDLTGNMRLKYDMFNNLSFSYNFDTKRDLSDPDLVNFSFSPSKMKLGIETSFRQNFTANYDPRLIGWFSTKWSYSSSYAEVYDKIIRVRKADLSITWSVSGSFQHQAMLGGKSRRQSGRGRRVRTSRRNVRGGTDTQEKKETGKLYDKPLAGLRFLTGWLDPLSYKYSESFAQSTPGMLARPDWNYRLGFSRVPDVLIGTDRRSPSASESVNYEAGSGFNLLGGIITTVKFKRSVSSDLVRQGNKYEKRSTAWPALSIRISRFKKFPLIKKQINKFIDIFVPKTSYSRTVKEDFSISGNFKTNRTESISYSPLLSLSFKLFKGFSITGSYTVTQSNRTIYDQSNGSLVSETKGERRALAFTTQYSFSAPGGIRIPLFGKLRFKSQVGINLKVSKNSSYNEQSTRGGPWEPLDDKSDLTISPNISYTFSRQVKGGISGRWQDTSDNQSNRQNHVRDIQLWTEIRF